MILIISNYVDSPQGEQILGIMGKNIMGGLPIQRKHGTRMNV